MIFGLMVISNSGFAWEKIPANGREFQYYSETNSVRKITWRKNKKVVRRKIYQRNGNLSRDTVYLSGRPVVKRTYHPNGRLKSVWSEKSQEVKFYRDDGVFIKKVSTAPNEVTPEDLPDSFFLR